MMEDQGISGLLAELRALREGNRKMREELAKERVWARMKKPRAGRGSLGR